MNILIIINIAISILLSSFSQAQTATPSDQSRSIPNKSKQRLPDPRHRSPLGLWEIDFIASKISKASGIKAKGQISFSEETAIARVSGSISRGKIKINPHAFRAISPNSWAFIIGHEFAHQSDTLRTNGVTSPAIELRADILGAKYARLAGFDIAEYMAWVLSRPDSTSPSHGSSHARAKHLGRHFKVSPKAVLYHLRIIRAKRYR